MTEIEMLEEISNLRARIATLEAGHMRQVDKLDGIKKDTEAMLEFFIALNGFWKVLEYIGKLAKPLTVLAAIFGGWFALKGLSK